MKRQWNILMKNFKVRNNKRTFTCKIFIEAKVPYFFYFPDKFVFAHFWRISIEWMKKLFFFFRVVFFFSGLQNWMNEWHVNLSAEKKTQKNTQNTQQKKNNPLLLKKKRTSSKSEWMADELFRGKKKSHLVFFFGFGKKKHDFLIWMNEWSTNLSA